MSNCARCDALMRDKLSGGICPDHPPGSFDDGRLYTLLDAKFELARRECQQFGHYWNVTETYDGTVTVLCDRCGRHPRAMTNEVERSDGSGA